MTALRADSERSFGVSFLALAGPPFFPPSRPRATAAGFFFFAMPEPYLSGQEFARPNTLYVSGYVCTIIRGLTIRERSRIVWLMNVLRPERRAAVINALVEGNSIRSIERMTGVNRNTIMRWAVIIGEGCGRFLDSDVRHVRAERVQVDEIWSFVYVKQARLNGKHNHLEMGDQYIFVSIDADTKLVISHLIGKRDAESCFYFMQDLKERLANRVQLTTDGFRPYIPAVEDTFGADVDYAQMVKLYGHTSKASSDRSWYSPVRVMAAIPKQITGRPRPRWVSTSFVERQNLTMRMQIRRLTRLTNAFSKKLRNLKAAVALHFAHYNFVRVHSTLRVTPAMEAGITDHIWSLDELIGTACSK